LRCRDARNRRAEELVLLVNNGFGLFSLPNGGNLWVNTKIDAPIDGPPTGVIEVKDTASGIEPHDLPKIFEPFFTAKKRTGLGLGFPSASAS